MGQAMTEMQTLAQREQRLLESRRREEEAETFTRRALADWLGDASPASPAAPALTNPMPSASAPAPTGLRSSRMTYSYSSEF
jgi:hypothetical protein